MNKITFSWSRSGNRQKGWEKCERPLPYKRHNSRLTSAGFWLRFVHHDDVEFSQLFSVLVKFVESCRFNSIWIMSEQEIASSSGEQPIEMGESQEKKDEFGEPEAKKRKISKPSTDEKKYKLEDRLGGILCCAVCLDLPRAAVYQVSA